MTTIRNLLAIPQSLSSSCFSHLHNSRELEIKWWEWECHCKNANPILITFIPISISVNNSVAIPIEIPWDPREPSDSHFMHTSV